MFRFDAEAGAMFRGEAARVTTVRSRVVTRAVMVDMTRAREAFLELMGE